MRETQLSKMAGGEQVWLRTSRPPATLALFQLYNCPMCQMAWDEAGSNGGIAEQFINMLLTVVLLR